MSGAFNTKSDGFMIAVLTAGIGAAATIGGVLMTHMFDEQSKRCEHSNTRFQRIDNLVERTAKLKKLNEFINDRSNEGCDFYNDAREEAATLRREATVGVRPSPPPDAASRVAEALATRPEGRSSVVVAPSDTSGPSPVAPPPPPPMTSFNGLATEGAPPRLKYEAPVAVAPPEAPPLVVTRAPRFSDPSEPFEGGIGASLVFRRDTDYALRSEQDTTTTYKVMRGSLAVTIDGQPYFSCKRGNQFRLYWKNMPAFTASSHEQSTELKIIGLEPGKHLGTSDCLDVLG